MFNKLALCVLFSTFVIIKTDFSNCNNEMSTYYLPKITKEKPSNEKTLKESEQNHGYKTTEGLSKFASDQKSDFEKVTMNEEKFFENTIPVYYLANYDKPLLMKPNLLGFVDNNQKNSSPKSSYYMYNKYEMKSKKSKDETEMEKKSDVKNEQSNAIKNPYRQLYMSPEMNFLSNFIAHLSKDKPKTTTETNTNLEQKVQHYYLSEPHYEFEYTINDPETNDKKYQKEKRIGYAVHGEYSLMEPDGSYRLVKYKADKDSGFQAEITNPKKMMQE